MQSTLLRLFQQKQRFGARHAARPYDKFAVRIADANNIAAIMGKHRMQRLFGVEVRRCRKFNNFFVVHNPKAFAFEIM